jgi:hypothetical protein
MTTAFGRTRVPRCGNFRVRAQGFPELRVVQRRRTVVAESNMSYGARRAPKTRREDAGLVDGIVRHSRSRDAVGDVLDIPRDVDQPATLAKILTVE